MICSRILSKRIKNASVVFNRNLQQNKTEFIKPEVTEVQIKVPWGTIAGKFWNYGCKQPILALHGWQDNAGSFDMLAPLLKNRSILAIDAPGHGISTWLPKGIPYHDSVIIHVIRRIKRYFGWEKVKLMGHSGGAIASFRYASFYPEETEFVVAIDALQFTPLTPTRFPQSNKDVASDIDKFLIYEEKNSPAPCHTEQMAIERWMKATHGSLNEVAARTLMIRGATRKEDGKLWNSSEDRQPILALHGWQDNAGSFDLVAPLLKNHSILAIDNPGHGLSSWLPQGIAYDDTTTILLIRKLKRHFNWGKIKFLGHSAGALVSFIYASLYPNDTEFVIALDSLQYRPIINVDEYCREYAKNIDKFLDLEEKYSVTNRVSYEEDEFVKKWITGSNCSLNEIAVKIMMRRGAKRTEDGKFFFSRDPRVKLNLPLRAIYTEEHLENIARLIKCPYLVLRSSSSFDDGEFSPNIVEIMKTNCREFSLISMPGSHHLHLTNVKSVAEIVKSFLVSHEI